MELGQDSGQHRCHGRSHSDSLAEEEREILEQDDEESLPDLEDLDDVSNILLHASPTLRRVEIGEQPIQALNKSTCVVGGQIEESEQELHPLIEGVHRGGQIPGELVLEVV